MNYYVFNWALKPQKLLIWLKCISEDSAERVQPNITLKRSADKEKAGNFRDFCEAGISHTLFFLLVWRQFVQIALTARGRLESLVSLTSCYLISLPWECCNSLWSLLGKLHFWFFTLSPSVRITVGSMTLFLDIEFLESWLLQELIWLDDPFFFFLVFLTMFISLDPNTWGLFLVGKTQRCLKVNHKLYKLCIETNKDVISVSHTWRVLSRLGNFSRTLTLSKCSCDVFHCYDFLA